MSPDLIHPFLHMSSEQSSESAAGRTKRSKSIFIKTPDSPAMAAQVPNWPTRPDVPMPAAEPTFFIWKIVVARGPVMAKVSVGGIRMSGALRLLPPEASKCQGPGR